MPTPRVSVLMTTYNGAATIGASIDSILAQSFRDFELLIVDDGSTDDTPAIIERIRDPRLRLLRTGSRSGIVAARNHGFAAARGHTIAPLDHDDVSDTERLARQVAFLDANPDVVLVATEIRILREGMIAAPHHPRAGDPLALRWLLLIDNPITWSSVMFRADAVRRLGSFLRPEFELADDFDFYHRLLGVGAIARLKEVLTTYRYHAANASLARAEALNANAARVLCGAYAPWLGDAAAAAAELVVRYLSDRQPVLDAMTLDRIGEILERLLERFCAAHDLSAADRRRIGGLAGEAWWRTARGGIRRGAPGMFGRYRARKLLTADFLPRLGDVAPSVGIGAVRRVLEKGVRG
jgi:glycosyltransferase involved in cell wall biosynthesis